MSPITVPLFSRRHYESVATALGNMLAEMREGMDLSNGEIKSYTEFFARSLRATNPRFKEAKFVETVIAIVNNYDDDLAD